MRRGDLLIDRSPPEGGDRAAQRVVLFQASIGRVTPSHFEDVLVGSCTTPVSKRNQRIGDLKGRGRQLGFAGAVPVAGDGSD